jgi:hypothetical protein
LLGLFPSVFRRFMMTDDATGAGAKNAMMASKVPGHSADGRTLQAANRVHRNPAGSH